MLLIAHIYTTVLLLIFAILRSMAQFNQETKETLKQKELKIIKNLVNQPRNALHRFPLLFTMLASFGLVSTFYGFEGIINRIDLLANNPVILLGVGLSLLALTGTLYKKLG